MSGHNSIPMLTYDHQTYSNVRVDQRSPLRRKLDTQLPSYYMLIHSVFLILIGLTGILLQVFLVLNHGPFYEYGHGFVGGVLCVVLAVIILIFSKLILFLHIAFQWRSYRKTLLSDAASMDIFSRLVATLKLKILTLMAPPL